MSCTHNKKREPKLEQEIKLLEDYRPTSDRYKGNYLPLQENKKELGSPPKKYRILVKQKRRWQQPPTIRGWIVRTKYTWNILLTRLKP